MSSNSIILSIRPEYVKRIVEGAKQVELRRVCPKQIHSGTLVLIYASSPIQAIVGAFKVDYVIQKPLQELWELVQNHAGVTRQEFDLYFQGVSNGVGIFFSETWTMENPVKLQQIQQKVEGFSPPQGFRYITKQELATSQLADFIDEAEMIMEKVSLYSG
jgi:predicted transcriptional regulator